MNLILQIILAFGSVAILLGLMAIVRLMAQRLGLDSEMQRKLVHIGTGLYALTLPWLFPDRWPVYMLIAVTLVVMLVLRSPRLAKTGLGSTLHGVERQSYGDILLAISIGLCFFLAQDRLFLYILPIAVLTLADAAAALAGSRYGTRLFQVEDGHKSIEGCVVFFVITLLVSIVCLMVMTPFDHLNIIVISLMVAGFGTLVEAASWRGFDNLFLPLGLLVFLATHADSGLVNLLSLAALFTATLMIFRFLSPMLGLTVHASRVYVTTIFLLCAVTEFQNAVIPILVLAAHGWSRRANPCKGNFPELDIVAGLVVVSLGWLTLGNATGWNAISFYGITAMGMVMGLSAIALATAPRRQQILGLVAVAVGLCVLRLWIIFSNPDTANWGGDLWDVSLMTLAVTGLAPTVFKNAFKRVRVTKTIGMSISIPLLAYLFAIDIVGILWR